jgi:hypothetical protein
MANAGTAAAGTKQKSIAPTTKAQISGDSQFGRRKTCL